MRIKRTDINIYEASARVSQKEEQSPEATSKMHRNMTARSREQQGVENNKQQTPYIYIYTPEHFDVFIQKSSRETLLRKRGFLRLASSLVSHLADANAIVSQSHPSCPAWVEQRELRNRRKAKMLSLFPPRCCNVSLFSRGVAHANLIQLRLDRVLCCWHARCIRERCCFIFKALNYILMIVRPVSQLFAEINSSNCPCAKPRLKVYHS